MCKKVSCFKNQQCEILHDSLSQTFSTIASNILRKTPCNRNSSSDICHSTTFFIHPQCKQLQMLFPFVAEKYTPTFSSFVNPCLFMAV